jgi:alkylated DNA repair dioxygenase AlkB
MPLAMQRIELGEGAYLELEPGWLDPEAAARALAQLSDEVPWEARAIRLFGREVMQPRLVSWHGEPEAEYTYSGVLHRPRPFTATLARLRERLCDELALPFNSVLCNLYRDGQDSMGMHSDAEPELGEQPVVASVSLGATRKFSLRHRRGPARGKLDLPLPGGSLLVMRGTTQHVYRHGVPKVQQATGPRINLTFRVVRPR